MSHPQPNTATLMRRLAALEARVADLEGPYAETAYRTRRDVVGLRITLTRVADALSVPAATDQEIDAALEAEDL
jgi:hypothetical protein